MQSSLGGEAQGRARNALLHLCCGYVPTPIKGVARLWNMQRTISFEDKKPYNRFGKSIPRRVPTHLNRTPAPGLVLKPVERARGCGV